MTTGVSLWQVAEDFRRLVCQSLVLTPPEQRSGCVGKYLFMIDDVARFDVDVQKEFLTSSVFQDTVPPPLNKEARTRIYTSLETLSRLLNGTLRAKIAFLTGKVKIQGDLLAFLKLTTLIKRQGVSARSLKQETIWESPFLRAQRQAQKNNELTLPSLVTKNMSVSLGFMVCHVWDCHKIFQVNVTYSFEIFTASPEVAPTFILKEVLLQGPGGESLLWRVGKPITCLPVYIPKPWGQEIWYTGVEKRGVSYVATESSSRVPLPWLWQALENWPHLGSCTELPPLVKVLDPLPLEAVGNLYSEIHMEKNEVYVVTHVPQAGGFIQFGANPAALQVHDNNVEQYKNELLKNVQKYEKIRRKIDAAFEDFRKEEGFASQDPVPGHVVLEWHNRLPVEWQEQERTSRAAMDFFMQKIPLSVGDVIRVPTRVPHSLQHGVRVVEFQTPTYERFILSFTQKVLTQDHWDTEKAVEFMDVRVCEKNTVELLEETSVYIREQICLFPDFEAQRISFKSEGVVEFAETFTQNSVVVFVLQGEVLMSQNDQEKQRFQPEECFLLVSGQIKMAGAFGVQFLITRRKHDKQ